MVNSFGPGNQKKPAKQSGRPKKLKNPLASASTGGTPAANPMGGTEMDFDMPDMGGMQMNAPSPMGGGNYEDLMMGLTGINGKQPSGFQGKMNPGVLEGPSTAGGGIAGMRSVGAQPTGVQSPQVAGWNDPAMGSFQMDTPMMNDPMMGQPDMGGMQMDTPMMNDPMMGGMQMGQPDMGQPFMGDPVMGQLQGPAGQQPPPGRPPQGNPPDGWQGEFDANPIQGPFYDKKDEYYKMMMEGTAPATDMQKGVYGEEVSVLEDLVEDANKPRPQDKKPKRRPMPGSRSSFSGGQAPAGGDALSDALSGGSQSDFSEAQLAGPATDSLPTTSQFNEEVAPSVSESPIVEPAVTPSDDTPEPSVSAGPVSKGDMENAKNWDTVDGEYKFMGADYHKQNTRPETDTKDWEETREEAAEDIKEGDKFSEVGDAAYGTASSKSRSAANEAAEPFNPDDWVFERTGMWSNQTTGKEISQDDYKRMSGSSGFEIGDQVNFGGSPPPISLPPTQPQTDADYYNKLVNPDPFQNPIIPDLPAGYGSQRVEGGGEYHEFPGREYDVKPEEIFDEYGEPLMGSQGIDSNAGGMTVADVRRRGTTPAQIQALVNNEVANTYQQANQGLGAMTGARPGMSGDIGSYAQQSLGPEVAARMAAGQAQIDIPWQYAMQHADQVRQRRDLAHKLGLEEAGMITGDYYDYLGDKMGYADTDNQIMRQMYGEMPDAFG